MFSLICGFSFRIFKSEYITWSNHRYQESKERLGMEYGALKRGSRTDRRYEGEMGKWKVERRAGWGGRINDTTDV